MTGGGHLSRPTVANRLSRYIGKGVKDEDDPEDETADHKAGKKSIKQRASVKTEVIYCERIWQLLKPGGQAAVVLPDGLLTNASLNVEDGKITGLS